MYTMRLSLVAIVLAAVSSASAFAPINVAAGRPVTSLAMSDEAKTGTVKW